MIPPAARWRIALALLADAAALAGVAVGTAVAELGLRGALAFRSTHRLPIDIAAEWLFVHREIALHAFGVATLIGMILGALPGARTLGRLVAGTVVVRASGRPFTVWVTLLRTFGLALSIASLGLGFLWALFDPHRRAMHDGLAGTVTVRRALLHGTSEEKA